jgi:hypothetical protein
MLLVTYEYSNQVTIRLFQPQDAGHSCQT